jgi:hypothetical protein
MACIVLGGDVNKPPRPWSVVYNWSVRLGKGIFLAYHSERETERRKREIRREQERDNKNLYLKRDYMH